MFRIVRIHDGMAPGERRRLADVQRMFRTEFDETPDYADRIPALLHRQGRLGYQVVLHAAEGDAGRLLGFTLAMYWSELRLGFLDYIATDPELRGHGIGTALYEGLRDWLVARDARGLLLEVPSDEPDKTVDPAWLPENRRRMAFYERFGARPIVNTGFDEPPPGAPRSMLALVFDGLGRDRPLRRDLARRFVRRLMVEKHGWEPRGKRLRRLVLSFSDDPVQLREARYVPEAMPVPPARQLRPLCVIATEGHALHHVRSKGYVERPARIDAILDALRDLRMEQVPLREHGLAPLEAVHDPAFVSYLDTVAGTLEAGALHYAGVFPGSARRPGWAPAPDVGNLGWYALDTFTPLSREAWQAARAAVDCALTGADLLLDGARLAYAVTRPPGHHAERARIGGFCYLNNAGIAAHALSAHGRVAILDLDYHHGNGTQDLFWNRGDVLTISIHGDPAAGYPRYVGYADEVGEGAGAGANLNLPLPDGTTDADWLAALDLALARVRAFEPTWLVVPIGFDILKGDPTGGFLLSARAVAAAGTRLGSLRMPVLVVQEGGYVLSNLRRGARAFLSRLSEAAL